MTIAPIETSYRGYRFRSRLEARWAVLLDYLEVDWSYELDGFKLDGLCYLPDFWIRFKGGHQWHYSDGYPPERGFWLEIKPTSPTDDALKKCSLLSRETGHNAYLAAGNIGLGEFHVWKFVKGKCIREKELSVYDCSSAADIHFDILNSYLFSQASPYGLYGKFGPFDDEMVQKAYIRAKTFRFDKEAQNPDRNWQYIGDLACPYKHGNFRVIEQCRRCRKGRQIVIYQDESPTAWGRCEGLCGAEDGDPLDRCGDKIGGAVISVLPLPDDFDFSGDIT